MNREMIEKLTKLFDGADSRLQETDPEWVEITTNFSQCETVSASRPQPISASDGHMISLLPQTRSWSCMA